MVQKIHPRGVIWVPNIPPHAVHLSEKNEDIAVQYEVVHGPVYLLRLQQIKMASSFGQFNQIFYHAGITFA